MSEQAEALKEKTIANSNLNNQLQLAMDRLQAQSNQIESGPVNKELVDR